MTSSGDQPATAPPGPRTIDHDLFCFDCEYNLRGLDDNGRCPECDRPILDTAEAARSFRANPAAVRCIIRSLRVILVANAAAVGLLILTSAVPGSLTPYVLAGAAVCVMIAGWGWFACTRGFSPRGGPVTPIPFVGATLVLAAFLAFNIAQAVWPTVPPIIDALPIRASLTLIFLALAMMIWGAFARVGLLIDINTVLHDRRIRAFGNHNGFIFMFFGLVIWPLGVIMYLYITVRMLLATVRAARAAGMRG